MKRECTFVQVKCDKMVTSVMPPSYGLEKRKQQNSIVFSFTRSQLQYKLCDLINLLLLRHRRVAGGEIAPPIPEVALAIFRLIKLLMRKLKKCVSANQQNC